MGFVKVVNFDGIIGKIGNRYFDVKTCTGVKYLLDKETFFRGSEDSVYRIISMNYDNGNGVATEILDRRILKSLLDSL